MKSWKHWPYWLKGGVIGGGVAVLFSILSFSCLYFLTSPGSWGFECLPFALPFLPIINFLFRFPATYSFPSVIITVIEIALYFTAGSLLGVLVYYIKSKK